MMLFLTVLLCGQFTAAEVADRHFILMQEEWVYRNTNRQDSPEVLALGAKTHKARQAASNKLKNYSPHHIHLLVQGSHHKDAEIKFRSICLIDPMIPCGHCLGTTICPRPDLTSAIYRPPCIACKEVYNDTNDNFVTNLYHSHASKCLHCFATGLERHSYEPILNQADQMRK